MNILDSIQQQISKDSVVLYMKGSPDFPQCGFSARVAHILKDLDINFVGVNVLEDEAVRHGIKKFSNWPTIPQLYINGEFIGGCDIVTELYQTGELQKQLQATIPNE